MLSPKDKHSGVEKTLRNLYWDVIAKQEGLSREMSERYEGVSIT
jgi:hypothetical protein